MNLSLKIACCAIILLGLLLVSAGIQAQNQPTGAKIQDVWTRVYEEYGGEKFPTIETSRTLYSTGSRGGRPKEWKPHLWKIAKDTIEDGRGTKESPIVKHKYVRDVGGKAGTIVLIIPAKDGKEEQRKLGIYDQFDDFLMIAWNPPGEPRPTSLMTQPKSKTTMVILRRGILK